MLYATDLCDSACRHCLIWAKRPIHYFPFASFLEVMKSKCISNQTKIGLEGGEFLLHPEADEYLAWFQKNHKRYDLLSNCLKPEKTIEKSLQYKPGHLYVSLDGNKETYAYMRGKDGYDGVLEVIRACHDKLPMSVMFTVSPYNQPEDLQHVANLCKKYDIDLRIGIYHNISFFDTIHGAHKTPFGSLRAQPPLSISKLKNHQAPDPLEKHISQYMADIQHWLLDGIKGFKENNEYLQLYDEWKQGKLHMNCYSIFDSLVILPNGDVPLCQNREDLLGNVHEQSLDAIFNGQHARSMQQEACSNCNGCWINFHRKYDVVLYRTLEKVLTKAIARRILG